MGWFIKNIGKEILHRNVYYYTIVDLKVMI